MKLIVILMVLYGRLKKSQKIKYGCVLNTVVTQRKSIFTFRIFIGDMNSRICAYCPWTLFYKGRSLESFAPQPVVHRTTAQREGQWNLYRERYMSGRGLVHLAYRCILDWTGCVSKFENVHFMRLMDEGSDSTARRTFSLNCLQKKVWNPVTKSWCL